MLALTSTLYVCLFVMQNLIMVTCAGETSNSSLKTRGAAAPTLELLGVFVRFRRTFAEVITFGGASAHEF